MIGGISSPSFAGYSKMSANKLISKAAGVASAEQVHPIRATERQIAKHVATEHQTAKPMSAPVKGIGELSPQKFDRAADFNFLSLLQSQSEQSWQPQQAETLAEKESFAENQMRVDVADELFNEHEQLDNELFNEQFDNEQFDNELLNEHEKVSENQRDLDSKAELSEEEQQVVKEMAARDNEVFTHENAHLAAAGRYAKGGAQYDYETGPDGKRYRVGGHVQIDTGEESTPEKTIEKAQVIKRAAYAPAKPSTEDRAVAAEADRMAAKANMEQAKTWREESFATPENLSGVNSRKNQYSQDNQDSQDNRVNIEPDAHAENKAGNSKISLLEAHVAQMAYNIQKAYNPHEFQKSLQMRGFSALG